MRDIADVPLRHPEKAARPDNPSPRKPPWIRVKAPGSPEYHATRRLMRELDLHTVCEEAACPNIGECWKERHATVMILGAVCTRACTFCNVATGRPDLLDPHEPRAGRRGGRRARPQPHRRDLGRPRRPRRRRRRAFRAHHRGDPRRRAGTRRSRCWSPISCARTARSRPSSRPGPTCYNHNLETVPRLYAEVRPGRALLPLAAPARSGEAARPGDVHQVRHHGRARRGTRPRYCR